MSTTAKRCPACRLICEPIVDMLDLVSPCCDEVVELAVLCDCGAEAHSGCETCFSCLLDSVIEDPREIETCSTSLQAEIAKGLAERLRPWLRTKQAA